MSFGIQKLLLSLKWCKIGPRLLLRTSRKSHTHFPFVSKSVTFDDLEGSCTFFSKHMCHAYLTLDLSSSCIQMGALGYMSTPFCFVIRQLLGFFPGQVHVLVVLFDDVHPVLSWSSWFSFVTSQFPVCCLTSCSRVVHSQDVSQSSDPSFFNYMFQFP